MKVHSGPYQVSGVGPPTGIPITLSSLIAIVCFPKGLHLQWLVGSWVQLWLFMSHLASNMHISYIMKLILLRKLNKMFFLRLYDDAHADDVQFLASVKRPRVVIIIGPIFVFQWFWFNFPWSRFYHINFRHIFPSKLWY